jgi:hypothetical protein
MSLYIFPDDFTTKLIVRTEYGSEPTDLQMLFHLSLSDNLFTLSVVTVYRELKHEPPYWDVWFKSSYYPLITKWTA